MEKYKLPPINVEQKRLMVEYVQKHPNLAKQKFSQEFTFKKAQQLWEELTQILNSIPGGSKKTWIQWRKTWTDIKKNTKNKAAGVQRYAEGTGGGPAVPKEKMINTLEKNILEIIGNVVQRGHENITETPIEFNFDNDGEENIIVEVVTSEDDTIHEAPSPEMDLHLNLTTSGAIRKLPYETPSSKSNNRLVNVSDIRQLSYDIIDEPSLKMNLISSESKLTPEKKTPDKILVKSNKPETKPLISTSGGKRLSVTRRLESSQKATADMIKSIESRTSITEVYYRQKIDYLEHMKKYHEKKIKLQENSIEVLTDMSKDLKEIKKYLSGGNESEDDGC